MPEIYEVKRMADYLKDNGVVGQKIKNIRFLNKGERILKNIQVNEFKNQCINQTIKAIKIKAKYTFLQLDSGTLEWHYRFTGIPHLKNIPYGNRLNSIFTLPIHNHRSSNGNRMRIEFNTGLILYFYDTRCLSSVKFHPTLLINQTPSYKELAEDLIAFKGFDNRIFTQENTQSRISLKTFLLNQKKAPSGIGNYLACEICAYANIDPSTPINVLKKDKIHALNEGLLNVKTFCEKSSSYEWFKVFNRKKCRICKTAIVKIKYKKNDQTTHYCSRCQIS